MAASIGLHLVGGAWLLQTRHNAALAEQRAVQVEIVTFPQERPPAPRETPRVRAAGPPVLARPAPAASDLAPATATPSGADDLAAAVFAAPRAVPAIKARVDCLTADPAQLSAADRERCARSGKSLEGPVSVARSKEKADELAAAGERKDAIVRYRNTITEPYPGLNCVYRGRCGK